MVPVPPTKHTNPPCLGLHQRKSSTLLAKINPACFTWFLSMSQASCRHLRNTLHFQRQVWDENGLCGERDRKGREGTEWILGGNILMKYACSSKPLAGFSWCELWFAFSAVWASETYLRISKVTLWICMQVHMFEV